MENLSNFTFPKANRIDSLPTELILLIFQYVDKTDLKSLRLVSRRLRDIAPWMLFTSVEVSPLVKRFEVLQSVANHPIISRCVRQIVYIEPLLCDSVCLTTEDGKLLLPFPGLSKGQTDAFEGLILQSDVHVNTIANALSKMPNVRKVICGNYGRLLEAGDMYFIPEFNQAMIQCDPRMSRLYPKAGENLSRIAIGMNNLYRDELEDFKSKRFNYGLGIVCRAISVSNVRLQTLSIGCPDGDSFNALYNIYPATFVLMSPRELEHICNAFQYLQKVSLKFKFDLKDERDSSSVRGSGIGENVARMLAAAKGLRDLRLDFNEICSNGCFTLKEYLGACTWPQLRSLYLFNKEVKEEELTDLIYRHRLTLKYLGLESVRLIDANWWTWARQVQPWVSSSSFEQIHFFSLRETERDHYWIPDCCLGSYLLQEEDDWVCSSCRDCRDNSY
jgi:F-box-like